MHLYSKVHAKDYDEIPVVRGEFHVVHGGVQDVVPVVCGEFQVHAAGHDVVPVVRGEFHGVYEEVHAHEEAQSNHEDVYETHVHKKHAEVRDGILREAQGKHQAMDSETGFVDLAPNRGRNKSKTAGNRGSSVKF